MAVKFQQWGDLAVAQSPSGAPIFGKGSQGGDLGLTAATPPSSAPSLQTVVLVGALVGAGYLLLKK